MLSSFRSFTHVSFDAFYRVTVLESQITDLETEASRLIRSLDTQKELLETERASSSKRIEALEKDQVEKDREIESCRDRLKQFGDYDELRRELEIMKVSTHDRSRFEFIQLTILRIR